MVAPPMFEKLMAMIASILAGGGFLAYGCYKVMKVSTSRTWPQVAGTISQSRLDCNSDSDGNTYAVTIQYGYVVNGAAYTAEQEMGQYARKSGAQAAVERYAVNSGVVVYYDPQKPANAVLEPSYTKAIFAIAGSIVFALLAGRLAYELTRG
jgi:hypothetical protein